MDERPPILRAMRRWRRITSPRRSSTGACSARAA